MRSGEFLRLALLSDELGLVDLRPLVSGPVPADIARVSARTTSPRTFSTGETSVMPIEVMHEVATFSLFLLVAGFRHLGWRCCNLWLHVVKI